MKSEQGWPKYYPLKEISNRTSKLIPHISTWSLRGDAFQLNAEFNSVHHISFERFSTLILFFMCHGTVNINYLFVLSLEFRKIIMIKGMCDSSLSLFISCVEGTIVVCICGWKTSWPYLPAISRRWESLKATQSAVLPTEMIVLKIFFFLQSSELSIHFYIV